jgi:RNA recognition motif-containing protein
MNIFVSNLSFAVQDDDLKGVSARVVTDRETRRSRGFGFVEMANKAEAEKAIAELDGAIADGRAIRVNEARPREERSSNSRPSFSKSRW